MKVKEYKSENKSMDKVPGKLTSLKSQIHDVSFSLEFSLA